MAIPFTSAVKPTAAEMNALARAHWRSTDEIDVVNTTTVTYLLNQTIEAGVMSTNRRLRVTMLGDHLNNTAGTDSLVVGILFGGSYVYRDSIPIATAATRRTVLVEMTVANLGSASSQWISGRIAIGSSTAATVGLSAVHSPAHTSPSLTAEWISAPFHNTAAVDTSAAVNVGIDVQHGVASASLSCRRKFYVIEVS